MCVRSSQQEQLGCFTANTHVYPSSIQSWRNKQRHNLGQTLASKLQKQSNRNVKNQIKLINYKYYKSKPKTKNEQSDGGYLFEQIEEMQNLLRVQR